MCCTVESIYRANFFDPLEHKDALKSVTLSKCNSRFRLVFCMKIGSEALEDKWGLVFIGRFELALYIFIVTA